MITLISIGISALAIILLYVGSYLTANGKLGPVTHDTHGQLLAVSIFMLVPVFNILLLLSCIWAMVKNSKWLDKPAFKSN